MPGQILGDRYKIEQQLGKKLGRWTLLARDLRSDQPVLLRLLFIDEETTFDELKLFKREIETLQTLAHPAIPNYLEYFEIDLPKDGKALALIQTYLEGISLKRYLQNNPPLSGKATKQLGNSILKILYYLHNHNPPIVHRDINPSNILIANSHENEGFNVHLVDFGSVKSFNSTAGYTDFTIVGTDGYSSPEQIGQRAVKASDLYSLGITLITALTGIEPVNLPRHGLKIDIEQIIRPDFAFANWLKSMTHPALDYRFKTAEEALEKLEPLL